MPNLVTRPCIETKTVKRQAYGTILLAVIIRSVPATYIHKHYRAFTPWHSQLYSFHLRAMNGIIRTDQPEP